MGPHNLHKEFIGRNANEKRDGKRQYQLKDLKGTVGVDASGWFHRSVHTQKGAAVFDMEPKVPLFDAIDKFMSFLRSVISTRENGEKDVILFMDGRSHPLKEVNEGQRRQQRVTTALNDLDNIYKHGSMSGGDYENVKLLRTAIAKRRGDFTAMVATECQKIGVRIYCAPFEADWQLIEAQRAGLIDIILSEDGDLFVIGGDKIVTEVDYVTGECCLYERSEILQRESMGSGSYTDHLPVLSNFLGNDYIDRLDGNGPVAVRKLMKQFIDANDDTERGLVLDTMKITKKWNKNDQHQAVDYTEKFWKAYNLQMFPPVFRLKPKSHEDTRPSGGIDVANEDTYDVVLEPLNELPPGVSKLKWGEMIGFGCDPTTLLQGDSRDLFHFKITETGSLPEVLEQPTSEYEPNYKVAHGANPDKRIPVEYWSDWALLTFLIERGLPTRGRYDRANAIRLAKRVLSLMKKQGERFTQPREWKEGQQTAYDEEEPLTVTGDGQFVWNGSWDIFIDILLEIDLLSDKDFFELFGVGRNGIQVRAQRLIAGGNFDIGKIQTARCRIKSNGHEAIAIRIECIPSMKSEPYWAMLVIDSTTMKLVPPPTSRCGCPAGLGGCSHLRGEYAILFYLQKHLKQRQLDSESLTQEDAASLLPVPMGTMKKVPIPFNFAFHDNDAEKELKRERQRREHDNRKRQSTLTSILSCVNAGLAINEDENTDDDDYVDEDASNGSVSGEEDEENLLDFDAEDTGVLVECDTEMLSNSGINEGDEFVQDVTLCDYIESHIGDAIKRASLSDSGNEVAEYKMEQSKVYQHLRDLLDGKDGPNESIQAKLLQLLRQESMHEAFTSGVMANNLLSHYLLHTREQRLTLIQQYKFALKQGMTKQDIIWTAERLGKLFAEYDGLGDRGFAGTSTSYPNCNAMKTPCFMEGRDQYTYGETIGTRDLCQGRYGSEVYNKRTNDYKYLQDKVPRSHFPHFEHMLNWATFKANMCQPFLIPHGCDDYFPTDTRHLQRPSKKVRASKSILSQHVARGDSGSLQGGSRSKRPLNYFEAAMPIRYFELGLDKVGLLMDGKDCVTDTVRLNSFISRSQYSDKMHCSAARYIMWVLPCGLSVTYTPVFLGRSSEKALVEYWGGSTYDLLHI